MEKLHRETNHKLKSDAKYIFGYKLRHILHKWGKTP